jgi:hypothetical protein
VKASRHESTTGRSWATRPSLPDQTNGLARRSVPMTTSKADGVLMTMPWPHRSLSSGAVADTGAETTQGASRMSELG